MGGARSASDQLRPAGCLTSSGSRRWRLRILTLAGFHLLPIVGVFMESCLEHPQVLVAMMQRTFLGRGHEVCRCRRRACRWSGA